MADVTMCNDTLCPRAMECYRFIADVHPIRQSFFVNSPLKEDKTCDEFILDKRHKILRKNK